MSSSYIVQVSPQDPSCISRRVWELFCDYGKIKYWSVMRILLFALCYVCIIRFPFLYIFTSVSAAYIEVANWVEGMQCRLYFFLCEWVFHIFWKQTWRTYHSKFFIYCGSKHWGVFQGTSNGAFIFPFCKLNIFNHSVRYLFNWPCPLSFRLEASKRSRSSILLAAFLANFHLTAILVTACFAYACFLCLHIFPPSKQPSEPHVRIKLFRRVLPFLTQEWAPSNVKLWSLEAHIRVKLLALV